MVPAADFGFIGGSSTLSINIPQDLKLDYLTAEKSGLFFDTPFGRSPEFQLIAIHGDNGDRKVLTCKMHGWRQGVTRAAASQQVFWVFKQAGIKRIIAEGGVGAVNHLLNTRDIVIPHDYMDFSCRKDVGLEDRHLLIMRDPFCSDMCRRLNDIAGKLWKGRVFNRSVYANTDGRHFESAAEVAYMKMAGADVVGQSICPEVYLAREIGACYAGLYQIVNYAEGIVAPWQHEELSDIFYTEGINMAYIVFEFLKDLPLERNSCQCANLRKDTLLKGIY